ncbi:lipopolysaccharide biosynthesis protein [Planomonospora corallina]|uniref:Lipopolysaccharide biosynthesis protein n=1 Tax=Planomonospora corallina TaxID=1806052 RepID=A0ABV8I2N0_9ACTN
MALLRRTPPEETPTPAPPRPAPPEETPAPAPAPAARQVRAGLPDPAGIRRAARGTRPAAWSRLPRPGGVAGDGLAGLAGAATGAAAQFLLVLLVGRHAGQETAGAFFAATALCLMTAGILRMDAGGGLVHVLARSGPDGLGRARDHLRAALLPTSVLSAVVAVAVCACAEAVAGAVGPAGTVRVLAVALPVVVCADILVSATRGAGSMRPTVLLDGIVRPVGQLLAVALVLLTPLPADPALLAAAWALPFLPVPPVAWLWLRRRLPRASGPPGPRCRPRPGPAVREPRTTLRRMRPGPAMGELWRHTWPRSAAAALQAVFQRLDVVIVAVLAGPAEAAVYTAATRFKVLGQLAGQGLARAVQPRLVRALAAGDLSEARALYQGTTCWLVLLTWPLWIGYAALAPWLLGLFGGGSDGTGDYASGVPVALVLAVTMALATACGLADVVLTAAGHARAGLVNLACATAVTVLLDVLLVPAHGAFGAALGWAAGVLVKNALPLWRLHRLGLHPFGRGTLAACGLRPRLPRPGGDG